MNRNTYLLVALLAIGFGTFSNYAIVNSDGSGSSTRTGSRAYIPSGSRYSGGYSGGHK